MNKWDCHCWMPYPNQCHKMKNGRWRCVDNYICIRDLVPTKNYYDAATHCIKKSRVNMENLETQIDKMFEKDPKAHITITEGDDPIYVLSKDVWNDLKATSHLKCKCRGYKAPETAFKQLDIPFFGVVTYIELYDCEVI